jgi:hypothetical protein
MPFQCKFTVTRELYYIEKIYFFAQKVKSSRVREQPLGRMGLRQKVRGSDSGTSRADWPETI